MAYNQTNKQPTKQHPKYRASPDFGLTGWNWKSGDRQLTFSELNIKHGPLIVIFNRPTNKKLKVVAITTDYQLKYIVGQTHIFILKFFLILVG